MCLIVEWSEIQKPSAENAYLIVRFGGIISCFVNTAMIRLPTSLVFRLCAGLLNGLKFKSHQQTMLILLLDLVAFLVALLIQP